MKRLCNYFYTMWAKALIIFLILFFMLQTSICFAETTVLYRENDTAVKNVFTQWDNFNYETSEYLTDAIEDSIDYILQYSLYYHRDSDDNSHTIINADDNYRFITSKLESYENLTYAVVNHDTGKVISNIKEINYKDSGINVRRYFPDAHNCLLIIRNAHNPYFENGTLTQYTEYVSTLAKNYSDSFDLYMFFGDGFSFALGSEDFEQTHYNTLSRVKTVTVLSAVYLLISTVFFIILLTVSGKTERGGKVYLGPSDHLPNDLKLLLYIIVLLSMSALYENSLYMALRADSYDLWLSYSSDFYIVRSYAAVLINSCIIMALGCTLKRQYKTGTLFTNTYIYKFFFAHRHKADN